MRRDVPEPGGMLAALRQVRAGVARALAPRPRRRSSWLQDPPGYQRAMDLLVKRLSAAQRAEFNRSRSFVVHGKSGRRYRINYAAAVNIDVLTAGGIVEYRLCAGPPGLPIPALLLAQKLMLETQEAEFLRIAIKHGYHTFRAIPP